MEDSRIQHKFTVASIQFNPILNDRDRNIASLLEVVEEAAIHGAKLIVTPEMATTGYHYQDREAITPYVDTIPGLTTSKFEQIAKHYSCFIVIGMPEVDQETGIYYNSAALIGPYGYVGKYRKVHLWAIEEHWAAWGDLGIPVFPTEIGNIAINICMDSIYFESARLAAVNGADILLFPTNSTSQSIFFLQSRAETNGLYVISANRSNTEQGYHMIGASAIWSPTGEKLAETAYIPDEEHDVDEPTIIYAEVDPCQYNNQAKQRLKERRSELYQELMLYIAPWDENKSTESQDVCVAALQYEPIVGDKEANLAKIKELIGRAVEVAVQERKRLDFVVLPELSLTGPLDQLNQAEILKLAETRTGLSIEKFKKLAKQHNLYIIFGFIQKEEQEYYNSAMLINSDGEIEGLYQKTHLSMTDKNWATPGKKIEVFSTQNIGRIGIMIGNDALFPEVAGVLAVKRADIIVIPSSWSSDVAQEISINKDMSINKYPEGAIAIWDAIAMGSQAYTIVANFCGTAASYQGKSAIYTLDALYGLDQPLVASSNQEEIVLTQFSTLQPEWWFNQEKLIMTRRPHFYKSLVAPLKE